MFRQFLAILALVTGLAAISEPARSAEMGAAVEAAVHCGEAAPWKSMPAVLGLQDPKRDARTSGGAPYLCSVCVVSVPAIQLQADRARE